VTLRRFVSACAISVVMAIALIRPVCSEVASQPNQAVQAERTDDVQAKLDKAISRSKQLEQIIQLLNKNVEAGNSPVQQKYREAQIAEYDHSIALMKYTRSMLDWVLYASNFCLWLVSIIVLAGVAFSGFQLWQAARLGVPQAETKLEIATNQFRLTSSVVGIVVLGMSFFFFYLFVKEIYAVKPIPVAQALEVKNNK